VRLRLRDALRGNMKTLTIVSALGGAYSAMVEVVTQPLMLDLGASMAVIGLLMSLSGFNGLIPTLVQPIAGALSDIKGRRPFLLAARLMTLLSLLSFLAASMLGTPLLLLPAVIFLGASAIGWPVWDAAVADSTDKGQRGLAYSLLMTAAILPGLFTRPLGGLMADRLGYAAVFAVAAALEATCLAALWSGFKEGWEAVADRISLREIIARCLNPPKGTRAFYILSGLDALFWGTSLGILSGILVDHFGLTNFELGVLLAVFSASLAATQLPIGGLIDRMGAKPIMICSELLGAPTAIILILASSLWHLLAAEVLMGLVMATWIPASRTYLSKVAHVDDIGGSMGRLSAFKGLVGFAAPAIGGVLYERLGLIGPFLPTMIGSLGLAVAMLILLEEA